MDKYKLYDKSAAFLVGMAIGDALGAVQEGLTREKKTEVFGYIRDYPVLEHRNRFYREPRSFTDDTQMALITIDSYLDRGRIDPADIARRMMVQRNEFRGLGTGTKKALDNLADGMNYTESGQERPGNSAALRCSPIGIIYFNHPKKIHDDMERLTGITHTHPASLAAALALADTIRHLIMDNDPEAIPIYISQKVESVNKDFAQKIRNLGSYSSVDEIGTSSHASETIPAAMYFFLNNLDDVRAGMLNAVNSGGDTDSIGAVTGALYGAFYGQTVFPEHWADRVNENNMLRIKMKKLAKMVLGVN